MKVVEGTAEEVIKYYRDYNKGTYADKSNTYSNIRNCYHWSKGKSSSVPIKDMDENYILNVIKKMLRENPSNDWLLREEEFKSLIVNLSDKILEKE